MPKVNATIEVGASLPRVRHYLRTRYEGKPYRLACRAALGMVPPIACEDDDDPGFLRFSASGRDSLFKFSFGGWSWSYRFRALSDDRTEVRVEYRWHWIFGLVGLGMIRAQAGNALAHDVLALQALEVAADPVGVEV